MMLKYFARLVVFTLALAGAVSLTKLYQLFQTPKLTPPVVYVEANAPAPFGPNVTWPVPLVFHKPRLITLDAARRESYTTFELERAPQPAAPEKLWMWTCFFVPSAGGVKRCWSSEPVEVRRPFANGERASLTITTPCAWYGKAGVPADGFYAHVRVSTVSAEDARAQGESLSFDIAAATPVVVEMPRASTTNTASAVAR